MFSGKNILVIGATGTIGQALIRKLLGYGPNVIRIFSRDEYKQYIMQQELAEFKNIRFLLGDVRDKERVDRAMSGVDIVFDLAALKHVPACEYNPFEAVQTNVIGTQNVIDCAIKNKVAKVIYTSSDKAVSPTNTMGATKLLAERLIVAADYSKGGKIPVFAAVRFGNVINSRGSVIPLWKGQILEKREITITDPGMTRFMMTIDQAADLTLKACEIARGGEIFVLKMPVIRLGDLAEVVRDEICEEKNIPFGEVEVKRIGLRPGEKLYEELMSEDEAVNAVEFDDMFAIYGIFNKTADEYRRGRRASCETYSSHGATPINKVEIKKLISCENQYNLLGKEL